MKALIKRVEFVKEKEGKYGMEYLFRVHYNDKEALYKAYKNKDQKHFIEGEESEFTETETEFKGTKYTWIKPPKKSFNSNYGRQLKKEQTKYSGFAVSYAKDLVIAGQLDKEDLPEYATVLFNLMVELDKSIES